MNIGQRVKTIKHKGLASYCQERVGTIERIIEHDELSGKKEFYIRFDEPTPCWGANDQVKIPVLRMPEEMFTAI